MDIKYLIAAKSFLEGSVGSELLSKTNNQHLKTTSVENINNDLNSKKVKTSKSVGSSILKRTSD